MNAQHIAGTLVGKTFDEAEAICKANGLTLAEEPILNCRFIGTRIKVSLDENRVVTEAIVG